MLNQRTLRSATAILLPALLTLILPGLIFAADDKPLTGYLPDAAQLPLVKSLEAIPIAPGLDDPPDRDRRGGPDNFGYRWRDTEEQGVQYQWIDITQGDMRGNQFQNVGDDWNSGQLDLGWTFNFYGREFRNFFVCSNGWLSFTSNSNDLAANDNFPNQGDPENLIAPFMSDLFPGTIWWYTNAQNRIAIVTWNVIHYGDRNRNYIFQVILTGNGRIKFQYQTNQRVPDNYFVGIGIQNAERNVGLTAYRQQGGGAPSNQYAIDISKALGWVTGTVSDLATGDPVEGARVRLSDGTAADTDDEGIYWMDEVLADPYTATASKFGYNTVLSDEFEVADQETTVVDFALPHPEIDVDTDGFEVELPRQGVRRDGFTIANAGNGPLDFAMRFTVPVRRDDPGDVIFDWNANELTGDGRMRGVTTDGDNYYLTGSNNQEEPNYIYVVNRNGELVRRMEQPHQNPSSIGLKGITTDGEFLYSADAREINQISFDGELIRAFPGPFNPTRYIVYVPETNHFWVCEIGSRVAEIDRDGNVIRQFDKPQRAAGLAWHPDDPDGFNLYIFHRIPNGSQLALAKMNPANGQHRPVMEFNIQQGDGALDCAITNGFNPLIWLFVALVENNVPDRVVGIELALNTSWVQIDPMTGTVEPESTTEIEARFDAGDWLPGTYELELEINHNAATEPVVLPLTLIVTNEGLEPQFYEFVATDIRHNFAITPVMLRGERAVFEDEIGVFTAGGLCIGGSLWFDRLTTVTAYGDNPDTDVLDGFEEGQAYAFRVWDHAADRDFAADFTWSSGARVFAAGGSSRGSLEVPGQVRENVWSLPLGWSLISSNVMPDDDGIAGLFAALVETGRLEMVKNGRGQFYRPGFGFDNIEHWVSSEGYLVKVNAASEWRMRGDLIDPTTPIDLVEGWNFVAYFPRRAFDAPTAFQSLGEALTIAKDGTGRFYLPAWDYNGIGNCVELMGYQVRLAEAAQLRYPLAGNAAMALPIAVPRWSKAPSPTSRNMSLLVIGKGLDAGMEIVVRTSLDQMVGSGVIDAEGRAGLALWGNDPETEVAEGAVEGEPLTFTILTGPGEVRPASARLLEGETTYRTDGWAVIELGMGTSTPFEFALFGVRPNPFNDRSTVAFALAEAGVARLALYDLAGREVREIASGRWNAGRHEVGLAAGDLASGTYILRLETPASSRAAKVLLLR